MKPLTGILAQIVEARKKRLREGEFSLTCPFSRRPGKHRFTEMLMRQGPQIIAEIKHRSPSAGVILDDAAERVGEIAASYRRGGAAAISVVIEPDFFGGDHLWIGQAKKASGLPILMKDFVFDTQQLDFAVAVGADAVLLICSILEERELARLLKEAAIRGLAALVETHSEEEILEAGRAGAEVIGVNARDLRSFRVDLELMASLGASIPGDIVGVAESGIKEPADVRRLFASGYSAFLVGESLLRSLDPAKSIRELRGEGTTEIKVCGLTREEDVVLCEEAGIDFVGFNFSPRSSRRVTLDQSVHLSSAARRAAVVAVFFQNEAKEMARVLEQLRPDVVQICDPAGTVDVDTGVRQRWQTFGVGRDDPARLAQVRADRIVLDAVSPGAGGGTGTTFDWTRVDEFRGAAPIVLAGGLTPGNVAEAIRKARPLAVDVASGIETDPGIKDAQKLADFVRAVRETIL